MTRRVTVIAAAIDAGYLLLFAALGSLPMSLVNLASLAMYGTAWWLIGQRRNRAALLLIWAEVLLHAALGSLLLGWDSGFHYYLLLFIPAIVIANTRGYAVPLVGGLLVYYLGLRAVCDAVGALQPLGAGATRLVLWLHVCIVFGMFASISAFYRRSILVAEQRLVRQASSDGLTGLANRSHFQALAATEIARARRHGQPLALLIADIDHFKAVNDRHGHGTGDRVLVEVGQRLKAGLREIDALARWGGEEFVAMLPDCPPERTAQVAERLRATVATPAPGLPPVTLSIGTTQVDPAEDLDAALRRADAALYASKAAGRDRVSRG
ncbi:hypothetical protein ISF6_2363 [Piscinibacter sakaiensis]|uniref:diguanylate cyclase n=2 Tax=Piscinibacter sakaiensis TaxID=1547922 RepID=A0A0K8P1M5_PISS1|nr:hypothetical protein ISF6_2363 [Piscinibacter sakaiensis]